MSQKNKIWGIVAAAGIGKRMMSAQPKQYLPLHGRRVIDHALLALCQSDSVDGVVVGIREGDRWWRAQPFEHQKLLAVSRGGEARAHTVLNALQQMLENNSADEEDWAMVHDGVRPCLAHADIERLVVAARSHAAGAVLVAKVTDTLKRGSREGVIEKTIGAGADAIYDVHWRALTPQMFRCGQLKTALQQSLERGILPSDESAAMEMSGIKPVAVEGHPANIKITVPADLELASLYLQDKQSGKKQ